MGATDDQMLPESSPGQASARSGVRRVNNFPVYIVGGLLSVFLLIMVLVASDRAAQKNRPAAENEIKAGNANIFALELTGGQKDGITPAAKTASQLPVAAPPLPGAVAIPIARPDKLENLDEPPVPPKDGGAQRDQQAAAEVDRLRIAKMSQLEEAIRSRTLIQTGAPRSAASTPTAPRGEAATHERMLAQIDTIQQQIISQTRDDPTAAYQARLKQLQVWAAGSPVQQINSDGGKDLGRFDGAQGDRWKLDSQVQAPRSPYELRAGFVLPAILISGINSDLPGQIMGQVSQDVFDTSTGRWKLIPQGSRLVGRYSSDVAYGQARVLIAWQRIVFPDGKAMDIGAMPGGDSAGYAGFNDQANNHYLRVFASAFLMSGVTAGIALSQPETVSITTRQSASSAISEALGQQLGQVTAQLITKNMNIAPTLEIRPGYRFNVIVTKDLTFSKPYQQFDY